MNRTGRAAAICLILGAAAGSGAFAQVVEAPAVRVDAAPVALTALPLSVQAPAALGLAPASLGLTSLSLTPLSPGRISPLSSPAPRVDSQAALRSVSRQALPLRQAAGAAGTRSEQLRSDAAWESARSKGRAASVDVPAYGLGLSANEAGAPQPSSPASRLKERLVQTYAPGTVLRVSEITSHGRQIGMDDAESMAAMAELSTKKTLIGLAQDRILFAAPREGEAPGLARGNDYLYQALALYDAESVGKMARAQWYLEQARTHYKQDEGQASKSNYALAKIITANASFEMLRGILDQLVHRAASLEERIDAQGFQRFIKQDFLDKAFIGLNERGPQPSAKALMGVQAMLDSVLGSPSRTPDLEAQQALQGIEQLKKFFNQLAPRDGDPEETAALQASRGGVSDEEGGALAKFATDLTKKAKEGKLTRLIGREAELQDLTEVLVRWKKNNPVLIGEPGVGKTQIVEGLAQRIANGEIEALKGKKIIRLDLSLLVAGTQYRGQFEQRVVDILKEAEAANGSVILFIDEIHRVMGLGATGEGGNDAANMIKEALTKGGFPVIGATTLNEFRKIEKDGALTRRFRPVTIAPPDQAETLEILKGLAPDIAKHHGLAIAPEAIEAAVKMSDKYLTERYQPDKAIDIIDEAAAYARIKKLPQVTAAEVALKISKWTGVPVAKLTESDREALKNLDKDLKSQVVNQDPAIAAISRAIRRNRLGYAEKKRPVGSFLFLGRTGVGKTETARALARKLFGSEKALMRIDMSEYMEKHSVSRLFGAPPGYVGYDEAGQLTERVRRQPYSVILFDEVEKAHEDVLNALLQILEEGSLTDGHGRKVDFSNTVIILTSNEGASKINDKNAAFAQDILLEAARARFKPELLGRLDDMIAFNNLDRSNLSGILDIQLGYLNADLKDKRMSVTLSSEAREFLVDRGNNPKAGARALKNAIQSELKDIMADAELEGIIKEGDAVEVTLDASDPQRPKLAVRPVPAK